MLNIRQLTCWKHGYGSSSQAHSPPVTLCAYYYMQCWSSQISKQTVLTGNAKYVNQINDACAQSGTKIERPMMRTNTYFRMDGTQSRRRGSRCRGCMGDTGPSSWSCSDPPGRRSMQSARFDSGRYPTGTASSTLIGQQITQK